MLLTDGNPNTNEELRAYESAVLSVAKTESVDLDVKRTLATEEISQEVLDFLLNRAAGTDPKGSGRRAAGVSDVVVSRQMKRWHAMHTLAIFYRDAFHDQLNDRYRAQFHEYREAARLAKEKTFEYGVGVVTQPIPIVEVEQVQIDSTPGPFDEAIYYVRVAWVNAAGQAGAASETTSFAAPPGGVPSVQLIDPPEGVTGFRVYMGLTPEAITLQGSAAVGESFALPPSGVVEGEPVSEGQEPDVYLTSAPFMRRG